MVRADHSGRDEALNLRGLLLGSSLELQWDYYLTRENDLRKISSKIVK
jgi:hypothetical protein